MSFDNLIRQLGNTIQLDLKFSDNGTVSVFFDEDEVYFEKYEKQLYVFADLGVVKDNLSVLKRIATANYLGNETGQGVISINETENNFVLHRLIDGEISYPEFEKILTMFIKAVRYWKEWISLPHEETVQGNSEKKNPMLTLGAMV
jgi:hypothetical protein